MLYMLFYIIRAIIEIILNVYVKIDKERTSEIDKQGIDQEEVDGRSVSYSQAKGYDF